jgi:hypothetical protein
MVHSGSAAPPQLHSKVDTNVGDFGEIGGLEGLALLSIAVVEDL